MKRNRYTGLTNKEADHLAREVVLTTLALLVFTVFFARPLWELTERIFP